jgi:hypothetical protein
VLQITTNEVHGQAVSGEFAVSASASISCIIITPIGIVKLQDMHFGNIVSGNAGTVELGADGVVSNVTGDVALDSKGSVFSSALFEITDGLVNSSETKRMFSGFSITLPSNDVILANSQGQTMRVSNFTSNTLASGTGRFKNEQGILSIGATLYVTSNQGLGSYASTTPFPVTVNFY